MVGLTSSIWKVATESCYSGITANELSQHSIYSFLFSWRPASAQRIICSSPSAENRYYVQHEHASHDSGFGHSGAFLLQEVFCLCPGPASTLQWLRVIVFRLPGVCLINRFGIVDRVTRPVASIGAFSLADFHWRKCSSCLLILGT